MLTAGLAWVAGALGPANVLAQATDTWVGSSSALFSTGGWTGGNNPPVAGDSLIFGIPGAAGTNLTDDQSGLAYAAITFNGTAAYTVSGNAFTLSTATAGTVINQLSSASPQTINNNLTLGGANQTIALTAGSQVLGGNISGMGGITITGSHTLTLAGNNTYMGTTFLAGSSTLALANANALADSTLSLSNNSTLSLLANTPTTFVPKAVTFPTQATITYNFNVNNNGAGTGNTLILENVGEVRGGSTTPTLNLTGGNGYTLQLSGTNTPNSVNSPIQIQDPTTLGSQTAGVTLSIPGGIIVNYPKSYALNLNGAGNFMLGPLITDGAYGLVPNFNATGTITLTGANNFAPTGTAATGVISAAGTLALNNAGAFTGLTALTVNAAVTFDNTSGGSITISATPTETWGSSFSFGTANTSGNLNLGTGAVILSTTPIITVANTNYGLTVGGAINGSYGLTKAGAGALTLTGVNTFTGNISGITGILTIGGAGGLSSTGTPGTYAGNIANAGTLVYNSSQADTWSGTLSGTGALVQSGSGTLTLSGPNTSTGTTTISGGTLALGNDGTTGTGPLMLGAGGTLNVAARTSPYVLPAGGLTTAGGATAATIVPPNSGTVNVGAGPITLVWNGASTGTDSTHPALTLAGGTLALAATQSVTINVPGPALSGGVYTLISGATAITGGGTIIPGFTGNGLATGASGSVTVAGTAVVLTVTAGPITILNVTNNPVTPIPGQSVLVAAAVTFAQGIQPGTVTLNGSPFGAGSAVPLILDIGPGDPCYLEYTNNVTVALAATPGNSDYSVTVTDTANDPPVTNWTELTIVPAITVTSVTASPASLTRNQGVLVSATATARNSTINGVTVNAGALGAGTAIPLVLVGANNTWTNTITVPASAPLGEATLVVTATDAAGDPAGTGKTVVTLKTAPGAGMAFLPPQSQILSDLVLANNNFTNNWPVAGCSSCLPGGRTSAEWTRGTYMEGDLALYAINQDPNIYNYAVQWGALFNWRLSGSYTTTDPNAQCAGQQYIELYLQNPVPANTNRLTNIVNSVNYWIANNVGLTAWSFVDAIHMSMPAYAQLATLNSNTMPALKNNATYPATMYSYFHQIKSILGPSNGLYNTTDHLWWRDPTFVTNYIAEDATPEKCY